jgi:hypothetical protein
MIILTANAATASTVAGAPILNVYEMPAANRTAVLRSVSANTCCESEWKKRQTSSKDGACQPFIDIQP